jgi:hypothetical protein
MISTTTTEAIVKFTAMVKRSTQARSKDLRLDMIDATNLMTEIANIMACLIVYQNETVKQNETTSVQMDGGRFC